MFNDRIFDWVSQFAWRRFCLVWMTLGTAWMAPLCGCAAPETAVLTAEQRTLNVESFERAWVLVRERHWDPQLNGVDWQAVHEEIKPQVESAATMDEAREAMRRMLGKLGQSHFSIIPGELLDEGSAEKSAKPQDPGDGEAESSSGDDPTDSDGGTSDGDSGGSKRRDAVTGLDIRAAGGKVFVIAVDDESPAAKAGVEVGWEIRSVAGTNVSSIAAGLDEAGQAAAHSEYLLGQVVARRLQGTAGDPVTAVFADAAGKERKLTIELAEPPGRRVQMGFLPPFYLKYRAERIEPNVGFIAFNCFFDPAYLMPKFGEAVQSFADADGIIIDVRGNPGGIGALACGMASWFVEEKSRKLGTMHMREVTLNFVINWRPNPYLGPLAILVDSGTGSTAEIFSGGLKDLGRARIFGQTSMGAALPSHVEKLPNGDSFLFAVANYISEGGQPLEGNGVIPHEEVIPTEEDLRGGRDVVLEAAVRWIEENKTSVAAGRRVTE